MHLNKGYQEKNKIVSSRKWAIVACIYPKVGVSFSEVSLKEVQSSFYITIMWIKKFRKGKKKWKKFCTIVGLHAKMLKT
jgi:hypothetical protein